MRSHVFSLVGCGTLTGIILVAPLCAQQPPPDKGAALFRTVVGPALVKHCFPCHSATADKLQGGLHLDSLKSALRGGTSGPALVPGNPDKSLIVQALRYPAHGRQMPPGGRLPTDLVESISNWVKAGAAWPAAANGSSPTQVQPKLRDMSGSGWWAIKPVVSPPVHRVIGKTTGEIDAFLLATLRKTGLGYAPRADRRTRIRRAYFDLIGVPPTPEEVERFVYDASPNAWAQVIDDLLARPQYGERSGRRWLDLARYVDDVVNNSDVIWMDNWRYRDWVIKSFNEDLPYRDFVRMQVAGDLLPAPPDRPNADGLIATGALVMGEWSQLDADKKKMIVDLADDQVRFVSTVFMGVTIGCARCHDHKFDPFTAADYYALAGIFNSSHVMKTVGAVGGSPVMLRIPLVPPAEQEPRKKWEAGVAELEARIKTAESAKLDAAALKTELAALKAKPVPEFPTAHAMQDGGQADGMFPGIADACVQVRGDYSKLDPAVKRGFPRVLMKSAQPKIEAGSGRLQLADWLTSHENPLTPRVIVNRIWQQHFGEGLVQTPSNFGALGTKPTHPELLDWLASKFMQDGWSIKSMHRLIMLSEAYQQVARAPSAALKKDPDNRLLARFRRRRMEVEVLRDSLLSVSGALDATMGGPPIAEPELNRRMVYMKVYRQADPVIGGIRQVFDAPDPKDSVDRRGESTVAPQALYFLNSPFVFSQAERLAARLRESKLLSDHDRLKRLYLTLFARPPIPAEAAAAAAFRASRGDDWAALCHALLCTNEFLYVE